MGKIYVAVLLMFVIFSSDRTVNAEVPLKLSGEITSVEMKDMGDSVVLHLQLNMSFKNTGNEPVLLLTASYPSSSPYATRNGLPFLAICSETFGILPGESDGKVLSSGCASPSIEGTSDWQVIRRELDDKTPPTRIIATIKAGESFEFKTPATLRYWKKRDPDSSFKDDAAWPEIKNAKSLSLELTYRIWSLELETRSGNREERPFGKMLQRRWKESGYLWLDDIVSQPIRLDLKSAVAKIAARP